MVLGQQVSQYPQLAGRPEGQGTRGSMGEHGAASGPRACASADEGLPPVHTPEADTARAQEVVACVELGVIALTLAWGELDGEAHHTMGGQDGA